MPKQHLQTLVARVTSETSAGVALSKRLQVFISSTYIDLKEERQSAVMAILKSGHFPAGMELFIAGKGTWPTIQQWIDDSDVFMLILGGRYGSLDTDLGISYTQREYEYALSTEKPTFALVMADDYTKQKIKLAGGDHSNFIETDNPQLLKSFKKNVMTNIIAKCEDLKDIKIAVHENINAFSKQTELVGWVRGNESGADKAIAQISLMQKEIDSLKSLNKKLVTSKSPEMDYTRIKSYLSHQKVKLNLTGKDPSESDALRLFSLYKAKISSGVNNSTMVKDELGFQLYSRLIPHLEIFELVQRDKAKPGVLWSAYSLSPSGRKFLAQYELEKLENNQVALAKGESSAVKLDSEKKVVKKTKPKPELPSS